MEEIIKKIAEAISKHYADADEWEDSAIWHSHLIRLQTVKKMLEGLNQGWHWEGGAWTADLPGGDDWMTLFNHYGMPIEFK